MGENYYASGGHASGAVYFQRSLGDLTADVDYSLVFFEQNEDYTQYIESVLDRGGAAATVDEIKAMKEVYYE